jgi:predicted enzyme related to lactoylglutathione lyase
MLFVKDFARMKSFYSGMLQAEPVNTEWTDRYACFELGGAEFALHAIPEEYARGVELTSPPKVREQNPVKVIFEVQDVPAERARLDSMGATMLTRAWEDPKESCEGADPEGNIFQITRSNAE